MIPRNPYSPPRAAQTSQAVQAEPSEPATSARRPASPPSDAPMPMQERIHASTLPPRQVAVPSTQERIAANIQAAHARLEADRHLLRPEALDHQQVHAQLVRNVVAEDAQAAARVASAGGSPLVAPDFERPTSPDPDPVIVPLFDEIPLDVQRHRLMLRAASATSLADTRALHALADDARARAEANHPIANVTTFSDAFVPSPWGGELLERALGEFVQAAQAWSAASDHYRAALQACRSAGLAESATDLEEAAAYCDARAHRLVTQRQVMLGIGQLKRAQRQIHRSFDAAQVLSTERKVTKILRSALLGTRSGKLAPLPLRSHPVEGFDDELDKVAAMARILLGMAKRLASRMQERAHVEPSVMQGPLGRTVPSVDLNRNLDAASLDRLSLASDELIDVAQTLRRTLRGELAQVPAPDGPSAPPGTSTSTPDATQELRLPAAGPSSAGDALVARMAAMSVEPQWPSASADSRAETRQASNETRVHEASVARLIERVSPVLQAAAKSMTSAGHAEQSRDKVGTFVAWHDATDAYQRITGTLALAKATWTAGTTDADAVQPIKRDAEGGLQRSESRMHAVLDDMMDEFVRQLHPEPEAAFGALAERSEWLGARVRESAVLRRRFDLQKSVVKRLDLLNQVFRTLSTLNDDEMPHAMLEAAETLKTFIEAAHTAAMADADTVRWNELASRIHDLRPTLFNGAKEREQKLIMAWASEAWPHVMSMGHAAQSAASRAHEILAGDPLPDEGTQPTYLPMPAPEQPVQQITAALLTASGAEALREALPVLPPDAPADVVTARQTNMKLLEHASVALEVSSTIVATFHEAWEALEKAPAGERPAIADELARRLRRVGNDQRQRMVQQSGIGEGLGGQYGKSVEEYLSTLSYTKRFTERMSMSFDVLNKLFKLQSTARALRNGAAATSDADLLNGKLALIREYDKLQESIDQKMERLIAQVTAESRSDNDATSECTEVDRICEHLRWRTQTEKHIVEAKVAIDELKRGLTNVGPDGHPAEDLRSLSALAELTDGLLTRTNKAIQQQAKVPSNKDRVKVMLNVTLPSLREIQDIKAQIARFEGASSSLSAAPPHPKPQRPPRQGERRGARGRRR